MRIRWKSGKSFPDLKINPKLYPGFERSDESFSSCNERHWRICFMKIYVYIFFVPSHLFTYNPLFVCFLGFCVVFFFLKYTNFQSSPCLAVLRIRKNWDKVFYNNCLYKHQNNRNNCEQLWTGQFISKHFTLLR